MNTTPNHLDPILQELPLSLLDPHPDNPRLANDDETIGGISAALKEAGRFDRNHAITARPKGDRYQVISGHQRREGALRAALTHIWVWLVDWDDARVLRELALANRQSALSLLEIAVHSLKIEKAQGQSNEGLAAFARGMGMQESNLRRARRGAEVFLVVREELASYIDIRSCRNRGMHLAEIQKADPAIWGDLARRCLTEGWSVRETAKQVAATLEAPDASSESATDDPNFGLEFADDPVVTSSNANETEGTDGDADEGDVIGDAAGDAEEEEDASEDGDEDDAGGDDEDEDAGDEGFDADSGDDVHGDDAAVVAAALPGDNGAGGAGSDPGKENEDDDAEEARDEEVPDEDRQDETGGEGEPETDDDYLDDDLNEPVRARLQPPGATVVLIVSQHELPVESAIGGRRVRLEVDEEGRAVLLDLGPVEPNPGGPGERNGNVTNRPAEGIGDGPSASSPAVANDPPPQGPTESSADVSPEVTELSMPPAPEGATHRLSFRAAAADIAHALALVSVVLPRPFDRENNSGFLFSPNAEKTLCYVYSRDSLHLARAGFAVADVTGDGAFILPATNAKVFQFAPGRVAVTAYRERPTSGKVPLLGGNWRLKIALRAGCAAIERQVFSPFFVGPCEVPVGQPTARPLPASLLRRAIQAASPFLARPPAWSKPITRAHVLRLFEDNGALHASDGGHAVHFTSKALEGIALSMSVVNAPLAINLLAACEGSVTIRNNEAMTFMVGDAKGREVVFGWKRVAVAHEEAASHDRESTVVRARSPSGDVPPRSRGQSQGRVSVRDMLDAAKYLREEMRPESPSRMRVVLDYDAALGRVQFEGTGACSMRSAWVELRDMPAERAPSFRATMPLRGALSLFSDVRQSDVELRVDAFPPEILPENLVASGLVEVATVEDVVVPHDGRRASPEGPSSPGTVSRSVLAVPLVELESAPAGVTASGNDVTPPPQPPPSRGLRKVGFAATSARTAAERRTARKGVAAETEPPPADVELEQTVATFVPASAPTPPAEVEPEVVTVASAPEGQSMQTDVEQRQTQVATVPDTDKASQAVPPSAGQVEWDGPRIQLDLT